MGGREKGKKEERKEGREGVMEERKKGRMGGWMEGRREGSVYY